MSDLIQQSSPPARLCIIRLSAIGDTCHALAVVRRLQDNWPECEITWIIGKVEATLLADILGIQFIIFDKSKGRAAYRDIKLQLAHREFDAALCMHASMRANALSRMIRAPLRLGFDWKRARDFQWLFTNARIPRGHEEHALDAMMSFATTIDAKKTPLRWNIPIAENDKDFAADFKSPNKPLVVISPCSSQRSRNFRNWPVQSYATIIEHLAKKRCRIVLTGGSSTLEREYGEALEKHPSVDNQIGATTLKQLLALIDTSDLVICPDSGPAHMATAVSTPVLGLYATSNPRRTGPYLSRELTVNRYPDALKTFLGKTPDQVRWGARVRHAEAMDLITIDDVIDKIDTFFDI